MSSNFPTSLDTYATLVDNVDDVLAAHANDRGDAIEALEVKVGADSSAVTSSHDYKLRHLPTQEGNWDAGSYEVRGQTLQSDVVTGTAPLIVASTTKVTNLNADLLDDLSSAALLTKCKVGSFTYDVSTTTDVVVSGIGFTPKGVTFLANIDTTTAQSSGVSDGTDDGCFYFTSGDASDVRRSDTVRSIALYVSPSAAAFAQVTSFNSDGWTLGRTKSGSPTGTATVNYLAVG